MTSRKPSAESHVQKFLEDFVFLDCRLGDHPKVISVVYRLDGATLRGVAATGPMGEQVGSILLPVENSLTGRVCQRREILSVAQVDDERVYFNRFTDRWAVESLLAVPLEESLGAITLASSERRDFHTREQGRALLLAALLSYLLLYSKDRSELPWSLTSKLGKAMCSARHELGFTQAQLASLVGTSRIALSRWEKGGQPPSAGPLRRWCEALGILSRDRPALVTVIDVTPQILHFLREKPERLAELPPAAFERFIADRLDRMGFDVQLTAPSTLRDGGIDLIAVPKVRNVGTYLLAGQVKHHRDGHKTGRVAVDRLLAWADSAFRLGLLVTNTSFTRDANWLADKNPDFLRLRDFEDLRRWIEDNYWSPEEWREIPKEIELAPGISVTVPKPTAHAALDLWPLNVAGVD